MAPGVAIHFDSLDYARMAARLRRTPIEIKARAFARVMARLRDMARNGAAGQSTSAGEGA